jgi:hypothetical protein
VSIQTSNREFRIGINITSAKSGLVASLIKDVGLARRELDGAFHLTVRGKEVVERIIGRVHILDVALREIAGVAPNA